MSFCPNRGLYCTLHDYFVNILILKESFIERKKPHLSRLTTDTVVLVLWRPYNLVHVPAVVIIGVEKAWSQNNPSY